jgi:hypothetical protein
MKLLPPKGKDTRPITDRVKESLFSILYTKGMLEDVIAADLFCGTGSMGLEALSRGAKFCTFIDGSRQVTQILDQNIEKAQFLAESKTVCANILKVGAAPTPEYGCYTVQDERKLRPRHQDRQTHGADRSADQRRRHGHPPHSPAITHRRPLCQPQKNRPTRMGQHENRLFPKAEPRQS